jgi:hypothetical protein
MIRGLTFARSFTIILTIADPLLNVDVTHFRETKIGIKVSTSINFNSIAYVNFFCKLYSSILSCFFFQASGGIFIIARLILFFSRSSLSY